MDEPTDSRRSLFDPATIGRLFRRLEGTDVDEIDVVCGSSRLYLRREPDKTVSAVAGERVAPGIRTDGVAVSAPLTGVFYLRPSPDQAPYVSPGSAIEVGQVVALIETMKLFNEVTADVAGEVLSVVAQQGDLVEAGQPLLFVRPREESEQS